MSALVISRHLRREKACPLYPCGVWAFSALMPKNNPKVAFISTRPIDDKDA